MAEEAKGQRTDLNMPQSKVKRMAAPGQTYGKATEQMESQRMVPMGSGQTQIQAAQAARPRPGGESLTRPTGRPDEAITAGAPFGDGVGPMAAGIPMYNPRDAAINEIRMIADMDQNEDLQNLLSRWMS
jgi:hypothetical protein